MIPWKGLALLFLIVGSLLLLAQWLGGWGLWASGPLFHGGVFR